MRSCTREPEPTRVSRRARTGARALGLDVRRRSLPLDAFPAELQGLEPWQVEDAPRIHAEHLERIAGRQRGTA